MNKTDNLLFILKKFEDISDKLGLSIDNRNIELFRSSRSRSRSGIVYYTVSDLEEIFDCFRNFFRKVFKKNRHVMLPKPSETAFQTANDLTDYHFFAKYIYTGISVEGDYVLSSLEQERFNEISETTLQMENDLTDYHILQKSVYTGVSVELDRSKEALEEYLLWFNEEDEDKDSSIDLNEKSPKLDGD